jgi:DNA sulfur modification protein DndC
MYNADMFDFSGSNLNAESVSFREELIRHYAKEHNTIFFCNHSAGKDSQAMYHTIKRLVRPDQIVVVHANLGRVEHDGVIEHIEATVDGLPVNVVQNKVKDFIGMVLLRGMFPSPQYRQCTSDLKTGPLDVFIRKTMKERGAKVAFNCIGLRAEESRQRAMKNPLWINKRLTLKPNKKGVVARTVFDWMPIFSLKTDEVFDTIYNAGQAPHPAYGERGEKYSRLSCRFCIMGCKQDIAHGAQTYPDHYAQIIALENVTGHTMFCRKVKGETVPYSLAEKAGITPDLDAVRKHEAALVLEREALIAQKAERDAEKAMARAARAADSAKRANRKRDALTVDMFG